MVEHQSFLVDSFNSKNRKIFKEKSEYLVFGHKTGVSMLCVSVYSGRGTGVLLRRDVARGDAGGVRGVPVEPGQQPADAHAGRPGAGGLLQRHAAPPLRRHWPRAARLRQAQPRRYGLLRTHRVSESNHHQP